MHENMPILHFWPDIFAQLKSDFPSAAKFENINATLLQSLWELSNGGDNFWTKMTWNVQRALAYENANYVCIFLHTYNPAVN